MMQTSARGGPVGRGRGAWLFSLLLLGGCAGAVASPGPSHDHPSPGTPAAEESLGEAAPTSGLRPPDLIGPVPITRDETAPLDWAAGEEWFVVVRRACRTLSVYRHGRPEKVYRDVAFGRVEGDKLHEGDGRTPLGFYTMIGRRLHPRWSRFILLDYPNQRDVERNRIAQRDGVAPAGPGSAIGIHGSDEPVLNRAGVDWTLGCISLLDEDVEDLYDRVPDGSPVLIVD